MASRASNAGAGTRLRSHRDIAAVVHLAKGAEVVVQLGDADAYEGRASACFEAEHDQEEAREVMEQFMSARMPRDGSAFGGEAGYKFLRSRAVVVVNLLLSARGLIESAL